MTNEQVFTHAGLKGAIFAELFLIARSESLGLVLPVGVLLTNVAADVSGNPDLMFLANETIRSSRIQLIEGARGGIVELAGSPDLVVEVVSPSSVKKDTVNFAGHTPKREFASTGSSIRAELKSAWKSVV